MNIAEAKRVCGLVDPLNGTFQRTIADYIARLEAKVQILESAKPLAVLPESTGMTDAEKEACQQCISWGDSCDMAFVFGHDLALSRLQPVNPDLLERLASDAWDAGWNRACNSKPGSNPPKGVWMRARLAAGKGATP